MLHRSSTRSNYFHPMTRSENSEANSCEMAESLSILEYSKIYVWKCRLWDIVALEIDSLQDQGLSWNLKYLICSSQMLEKNQWCHAPVQPWLWTLIDLDSLEISSLDFLSCKILWPEEWIWPLFQFFNHLLWNWLFILLLISP